jgi:hypothetical protein
LYKKMRSPLISLLIGITLGISGCDHIQGEQLDESDLDPSGIPAGPGVFTGRSGEWKVLGR